MAQIMEKVYSYSTPKNKNISRNTMAKVEKKCGKVQRTLVAQEYIKNPLLLDKKNKFDLRVYMLIASTNPLIVYYHDGYIQAGLKKYKPKSTSKNVLLITQQINKKVFKKALKNYFVDMNADQLKDYQVWPMEKLQDLLLRNGKTFETNWFNNTLRPELQKAILHLARSSRANLLKASGIFELFAVDFAIDADFKPWIIDVDTNPFITMPTPEKREFIIKMLDDMFEIELGYYKSRMSRIFKFVRQMYEEVKQVSKLDSEYWQEEFGKVNANKFEDQYLPNKTNGWAKVIDRSIEEDNYIGLLPKNCVL